MTFATTQQYILSHATRSENKLAVTQYQEKKRKLNTRVKGISQMKKAPDDLCDLGLIGAIY